MTGHREGGHIWSLIMDRVHRRGAWERVIRKNQDAVVGEKRAGARKGDAIESKLRGDERHLSHGLEYHVAVDVGREKAASDKTASIEGKSIPSHNDRGLTAKLLLVADCMPIRT